ncbi:MAG TPA: alkaline phosphatase family protein, partial [Polyangia bacterium]
MRKMLTLAPLAIAVAAIGGCANTSGNTAVTCSAVTATDTQPSPDWQGTVFTIVMENHSQGDILGNKDAPFINSLAAQNAVAAGYRDNLVHPSEPNYLWMVAGENFGVLDDNEPTSHHIDSTSHIADQLDAAGLSWKGYMESMGNPCGLTGQYPYEPKHDPFVYFNDINGWDGSAFHPETRCNTHVVDYSQFDADLASKSLAKYVFITPNMIHDMHDGSVADGDQWLSQEVPKILASDAFNNGGVLFLTWDEGGGYPQSDDPPMIVISPHAKRGFVSQTPFNASSYLKTVQTILGLQTLPCNPSADGVKTMDELFDVSIAPSKKGATGGGTTTPTGGGTTTPTGGTTTPTGGGTTTPTGGGTTTPTTGGVT